MSDLVPKEYKPKVRLQIGAGYRFVNGVVNQQLKEIGKSEKVEDNNFYTGTKITFLPSKKTLSSQTPVPTNCTFYGSTS